MWMMTSRRLEIRNEKTHKGSHIIQKHLWTIHRHSIGHPRRLYNLTRPPPHSTRPHVITSVIVMMWLHLLRRVFPSEASPFVSGLLSNRADMAERKRPKKNLPAGRPPSKQHPLSLSITLGDLHLISYSATPTYAFGPVPLIHWLSRPACIG